MIHIYPAIMGISAVEIEKLQRLGKMIDRVHIDVMDTIFVPNITIGSEYINEYATKKGFFVWLHLMIKNVPSFFEVYDFPEGSLVSFHLESTNNIFDNIKIIKEKKCVPSIAINPKTPIKELLPFINSVNHILIMSVNPGFSGQFFLPEVISKIDDLVCYRKEHDISLRIGIDGGINKSNIAHLIEKGVEDFAISSGIFSYENPVVALQELYDVIKESECIAE